VRNNPLVLVDPMGLCTFDAEGNAVEDENGACYEGGFGGSVTVVASAPPDVMPIFVSLPSLLSDTQQPMQTASPPAVTEAGAKPPKSGINNNCVAGYGAAGAAAGAAVGWVGGGAAAVLGAETGPADIAIAYGGKVLSSAVGTYVGQQTGQLIASIVCSSAAGSGGGSSTQKFNPRDPGHRSMTGDQIISQFKKGSIRSVFPGKMLSKTFNEIDALAREGDPAAQTARKLLTDARFNK